MLSKGYYLDLTEALIDSCMYCSRGEETSKPIGFGSNIDVKWNGFFSLYLEGGSLDEAGGMRANTKDYRNLVGRMVNRTLEITANPGQHRGSSSNDYKTML